MKGNINMSQIAVPIAFYKTETAMSGTDVLKNVGELRQGKNSEYESFTYGKTKYPIGAVIIDSDPDGYNVYIERETFLIKNRI